MELDLNNMKSMYAYLYNKADKSVKITHDENNKGWRNEIKILKSNTMSVSIYKADSSPLSYELRRATPMGGYGRRQYGGIPDISTLDNILKEVMDATPVLRTNLKLQLFEFKAYEGITCTAGKGGFISRSDFTIYHCRVIGVVEIDDAGYIKDALYGEHDSLWFEMDCSNKLGATFNILYNGEDKWTPIKRYGKKRITGSMQPKSSVHLENISTADKELMDLATQMWLTGHLTTNK